MNEVAEPVGRYFEDWQEGQGWISPGRTVTEADLVNFAGLSGDFNQAHTDVEFARGSRYERRLVHGLLVLSIATGLRQRGGLLDGVLVAWREITWWKFVAPVFVGDTVRVQTVITAKRASRAATRGALVQDVHIVNQDDAIVQQGEFVTLVRTRPVESP